MSTFTYGFYNSINNDRLYDAIQMSELFDGLINDGIYATIGDCFVVKENIDSENSVTIGSGRAWFNHTWNKLDAPMVLTGTSPELSVNRIDMIVIEVDTNTRTNSIKWINGTPSENPLKPDIVNTETTHQHPLCYITRIPGMNKIEQQYIENVIGTSVTPFVTGIIETIQADELFAQWLDQWESMKEYFDREWDNIVGKLGEDPAGSLQLQINEMDMNMHGFQSKETNFLSNDDIEEIFDDGKKIVTHTVSDSQITQTLYNNDVVIGVKTITFESNGDITEVYEPNTP